MSIPPRAALAAVVFSAAAALFAPIARANPYVDEGVRHYREADFSAALRAFDEAERRGGLSREELIVLLEGRALVQYALEAPAAFEAELVQLASIDPEHRFPPEVPPEVAESFARARRRAGGGVRLRATHSAVAGGVLIEAVVERDVAGLVRSIAISGRRRGGRWQTADEGLELRASRGDHIEYFVVARGPGGAPIAQVGSSERPRALVHGDAVLSSPTRRSPRGRRHAEGDDDGGGVSGWVFVGIGGVLVAGAVVAAVLVTSNAESDETQPGLPTVVP